MRLADVAKHFDQLPCVDGYTGGATLFKAQFMPFDDSMRDGLTIERRIMSVAPATSPPSRKVVTAGGKTWLIGDYAPDYYLNSEIRRKYVVQGADGLADIKTIAQVLANQSGVQAYTNLVYVKSAKEIEVSSGRYEEYNAYFTTAETLAERHMIQLSSVWYLCRTVFKTAAGFKVAAVSELETAPIETATLGTRVFDPVTETYSNTPTTATCIRVRWQDAFEYLTKSSETYERGDLQAFLPIATAVKPQDTLGLSDGTWKVLSVLNETSYKSVHLRRA